MISSSWMVVGGVQVYKESGDGVLLLRRFPKLNYKENTPGAVITVGLLNAHLHGVGGCFGGRIYGGQVAGQYQPPPTWRCSSIRPWRNVSPR